LARVKQQRETIQLEKTKEIEDKTDGDNTNPNLKCVGIERRSKRGWENASLKRKGLMRHHIHLGETERVAQQTGQEKRDREVKPDRVEEETGCPSIG